MFRDDTTPTGTDTPTVVPTEDTTNNGGEQAPADSEGETPTDETKPTE